MKQQKPKNETYRITIDTIALDGAVVDTNHTDTPGYLLMALDHNRQVINTHKMSISGREILAMLCSDPDIRELVIRDFAFFSLADKVFSPGGHEPDDGADMSVEDILAAARESYLEEHPEHRAALAGENDSDSQGEAEAPKRPKHWLDRRKRKEDKKCRG